MEVGRRGFLGALAALVSLDPERLLWRPKLISIPAERVREEFYAWGYIDDGAGYLASTPRERAELFDRPAAIAIKRRIDARMAEEGVRRATFERMGLPLGAALARAGRIEVLPEASLSIVYDILKGKHVGYYAAKVLI